MPNYGVAEAKNNFTYLLDRVQDGESITITRHGKPIAELRAMPESKPKMTMEQRRALLDEFAARRDARRPLGMSASGLIRQIRDEGY